MTSARVPAPRRCALVAGGTGAIGAAICRALAADGMAVCVGFCSAAAEGEAVAAEIVDGGGVSCAVPLDLRDADGIRALCGEVFEQHGSLDVLVNAAGLTAEMPAAGMDDETWRRVLEVNLDGAFRLCREVARYMVPARWGRIVNLSSVAATRGGRGQAGYAAAKAGVEALTRVMAIELGRKGVLVNCVAPGIIETPMTARIRREFGPQLTQQTALLRFGSAEEVAALVAFLCSERASYITGQVIRVDGGFAL